MRRRGSERDYQPLLSIADPSRPLKKTQPFSFWEIYLILLAENKIGSQENTRASANRRSDNRSLANQQNSMPQPSKVIRGTQLAIRCLIGS
jgi:hypothetical protein